MYFIVSVSSITTTNKILFTFFDVVFFGSSPALLMLSCPAILFIVILCRVNSSLRRISLRSWIKGFFNECDQKNNQLFKYLSKCRLIFDKVMTLQRMGPEYCSSAIYYTHNHVDIYYTYNYVNIHYTHDVNIHYTHNHVDYRI